MLNVFQKLLRAVSRRFRTKRPDCPARCQTCGKPGPLSRCLDCGAWKCAECKPEWANLCAVCWYTKDGIEADKLEQEVGG